jgi:leucyl aminopeptidase
MTDFFIAADSSIKTTPIIPIDQTYMDEWRGTLPAPDRASLHATGFTATAGELAFIHNNDGTLKSVILGLGQINKTSPDAHAAPWAAAAHKLPTGAYHIEAAVAGPDAWDICFAWATGQYTFKITAAHTQDAPITPCKQLRLPHGINLADLRPAIAADQLTRDLINTPANHMGPQDLADVARDLALTHDASIALLEGDDVRRARYPAVYAVGQASDRPPVVIDLEWGNPAHPLITIVGKGVCFDTGGLDLKPASAMRLMKKDMGGAAHALGLAKWIMDSTLPVQLRVLIPAVDNAVSGNAFRPGDVIETRAGKTIEITNTDAEGRLVLADCLHEAASRTPDLLIDFATLTGAARVALGPDIPAFTCNNANLAIDFMGASQLSHDPVWELPLHAGYRSMLDSKVADLVNASESGFAGTITAALFLKEFVPDNIPWLHLDLYGWCKGRLGHSEGAAMQSLRAVYHLLMQLYQGTRPQT